MVTATVATYTTHLRAWFKWLQFQDHRADDPMVKIGAVRHPRPVSSDGLARLLTDCRIWPTTRAKVLLAACQGLRVAEIAKIRGEDIVESRFLVVNGKGNRTKTLPLHPLIAELAKTMPAQGVNRAGFSAGLIPRKDGDHARIEAEEADAEEVPVRAA